MSVPRPTTLKVGPLVYTFEFKHPLPGGVLGQTNSHLLTVRIDDSAAKMVQKQTVVHEVLHCCFFAAMSHLFQDGKSESLKEEGLVSNLETPLFQVLRDNPQLLKWLVSE